MSFDFVLADGRKVEVVGRYVAGEDNGRDGPSYDAGFEIESISYQGDDGVKVTRDDEYDICAAAMADA